MRYNVDSIIENVDTLTLCEIIGLPVKKKGNSYFSPCCNPSHSEKKIFSHNKIYPGNGGCYCFACGQSYNPYGMVVNWAEKNGQTISGSEVIGILGDAAGGRELYAVKGPYKPEAKFPLSKRIMELLGFRNNTGFTQIVNCETDDEGYIMSATEKRVPGISIRRMWLEDKAAFWYIVGTKSRQMLEKYTAFADVFSTSKTVDGQQIAMVYKRNALDLKTFMLSVQSKI